jgi:hypothetical protein
VSLWRVFCGYSYAREYLQTTRNKLKEGNTMKTETIAQLVKSAMVNYEAMYDSLDKKKPHAYDSEEYKRWSYEQERHAEMLDEALEALKSLGIDVDIRY